MNDTRKLLIAVQTFKKIIESDFVYAYKNQLALNLMQSSGGYYFLFSQRRFGSGDYSEEDIIRKQTYVSYWNKF